MLFCLRIVIMNIDESNNELIDNSREFAYFELIFYSLLFYRECRWLLYSCLPLNPLPTQHFKTKYFCFTFL